MPLLLKPKTSDKFQLSPIKAMELAAAKIPGVISLAQGIPSFATPRVITDFVQEKISQGLCDKYSLTTGLSELREEISLSLEKENLKYDPETEIIVTVGSIEGLTAAVLAVTTPGDEVLIPSPTYASYLGSISIAGCSAKYFELDEDRNFDFKVSEIEKNISRKTKAILYCSPNNPTGTLYSEDKTRKLLWLAEKYNLTVIIDEVYKDFYYTNDQHFSLCSVAEARSRVIRVCSFSKAFAMTGWRVGFLHADKSQVEKIIKYHDALVTCAPVVSQYAAIAALRYGDEALAGFKKEFKERRDFTIKMLDQLSLVLDYQMPKATYFAFPRIKDTVPLAKNSVALAYDILEKAKVALVPGVAFGPSGESHLRIMYGREKQVLEEGLNRLGEYFLSSRRTVGGVKPAEIASAAKHKAAPARLTSLRRKLITGVLACSAKIYLKRNKPLIIGISGTRGKTVFKRAITELLSKQFKTRANILSHNTEIGLPLSILQLAVPQGIKAQFGFAAKLIKKVFCSNEDSEVLVLEYGISRLEDGQQLSWIAKPDWLIISDVAFNDPSLGYQEILAGIAELVKRMPTNRILWSSDDQTIGELCVNLDPKLSFSQQELQNGVLQTSSGPIKVEKELVGLSSQLSLIAAVKLALLLGIERSIVNKFCN